MDEDQTTGGMPAGDDGGVPAPMPAMPEAPAEPTDGGTEPPAPAA